MNTDEIIAMAKEADIDVDAWGVMGVLCLSGFAALVAAKEREAIAAHYDAQPHMEFFGKELADEIRARGTKEGA